ncbi:hypothetical protein ASPVEDRAFT_95414, partial [Aspergillus versicolor CBS 583.65]
LAVALGSVEGRPQFFLKDATPNLPSDPNTISTCTWWWDNVDGSIACENMPSQWGISMEDFLLWNPSITSDCGNYLTGRSYCVEAPAGGSEPPPTTTSAGPMPTDGNGVETPLPTQPGMVDDCEDFYFVEIGDSCAAIASEQDISQAQFVEWNPSVGSHCTGLWANAYACVGLIGGAAPGPSPTATTTSPPGNGIATPTPTQPGMVDDCDDFYFVEVGDSCAAIASEHGISQAQFAEWNPSVGSDCAGLWADAYVCVHRIGTPTNPEPTTTTTSSGNGVATPTPIQDGMVSNCGRFHFVVQGDICASIAATYGITTANFVRWNPAVKNDCSGLWAETYACVGLI